MYKTGLKQEKTPIKDEKLIKDNALGDDRNLAENGINPKYWYSVGDGFRLALWLRQHCLNYDNMPVAKDGEEYTAFRENSNRILVTDPYYTDNFSDYLGDDLARITATYNFRELTPWTQMPATIIIPLLSGLHWRTIKVDINYDSKTASILFDDPYGKEAFPETLKLVIIPVIKSNIEKLIRVQTKDDSFNLISEIPTVEKTQDQQGYGENSWDCGPITFSNIETYIKCSIGQNTTYFIPEYTETTHKEIIATVRETDIQHYSEVAGIIINEERIKEIKEHLDKGRQVQNQKLEELSSISLLDTSNLDSLQVSMIFEVLDNKRLFEGKGKTEEYTKKELDYAFKVVLGEIYLPLKNPSATANKKEPADYLHQGFGDIFMKSSNDNQDGDGNFDFLANKLQDIDRPSLEITVSQLEEKLFSEFKLPGEPFDIDKQKKDSLDNIKDFHKQGIADFNKGFFKQAETSFVEALKPALSKPSMKKLAWNDAEVDKYELLDSIYHLGLVYLEYAKNGTETNSHAKAAAIFQYCAEFSVNHDVSLKIDDVTIGDKEYFLGRAYLTEKRFLEDLLELGSKQSNEEFCKESHQKFTDYKSQLKQVRERTKSKLEKISSLTMDEIVQRANEVEDIYSNCTSFFVNHTNKPESKGLVQRLLDECHEQLGGIPEGCVHSVIGLGSLSLGTITPWSDLEFAILVDATKPEYQEKIPEYKEYCRKLTKLLSIKVINLGETIIPAVGIESLNDVKALDLSKEWFWDDVTYRGVSFDGTQWHACKLPLGRQGYKGKPDYELIHTPKEMAAFQEEETENLGGAKNWFETDRHLVQSLKSVCLIEGSQKLLDEYRGILNNVNCDVQKKRTLEILKEDIEKFRLKLGEDEEGKLLDVKKHIYRLADRIIVSLSEYYEIAAKEGQPFFTVWQALKEMQESSILGEKGAQYLKEALAVATELRLNTYANKGQQGIMSTYIPDLNHIVEEQKKHQLQKTFYINNTEPLKHFYYVLLSLQHIVKGFCDSQKQQNSKLVLANSDYIKMMVHSRFLEYKEALKYSEKVSKEYEYKEDLAVLNNIFFLLKKTDASNLIDFANYYLGIAKSKYSDNLTHSNIAVAYTNLGIALSFHNKHDQAISAYHEALKILQGLQEKKFDNLNIVELYNNLGVVLMKASFYDKAIICYENLLKFCLQLTHTKEKKVDYSYISTIYHNLALGYSHKSEYSKSISAYYKALSIKINLYQDSPNNPDIATTCHELGVVYRKIGYYDQALECIQNALSIYLKLYNGMKHQDIASSYTGLGVVYASRKLYDKAVEFYYKAMEASPIEDYAIYGSLASALCNKKDYTQACLYHEKTLELKKELYEYNLNHPDIAISYYNWAIALFYKGECKKSIEKLKEALRINEGVYATTPNYPPLADNYNLLGFILNHEGHYADAIKYHLKALNIQEEAYKVNCNHVSIATSCHNLAIAYLNKGYPHMACDYAKRFLDIHKHNNNAESIEIGAMLYRASLLQVLNCEYLKEDLKGANEYLSMINANTGNNITLYSEDFITLQLEISDIAYDMKLLHVAINCQKVLLRIDPTLQYRNHYHNLGCFYACSGNIKEANEAFVNALKALTNYVHIENTGDLHAEYAQFLIINSQQPKVDKSEITTHLYLAKNSDKPGGLQYGIIEKDTVCNFLQKFIKEKSTTVSVSPKVLAYYLLTTQTEYISANDSLDNLLKEFSNYCEIMQNNISFRLLSDAYNSVANVELKEKYLKCAEFMEQIDKIIDGKLNLDSEECTIKRSDIEEHASRLNELAPKILALGELNRLKDCYVKIFKIYSEILTDKPEELQTVINNLATLCLAKYEIEEYVDLKIKFGVVLNSKLVESLGKDVKQILDIEREITKQLQIALSIQQNENLSETEERADHEVYTLGNSEEML